ncbi:acetyl-coenzyme A synthetase N-terminal domain-containing protein, partial [Acidiplasma cupricumulans]|uniref:acetyl-coenzyme A synthetase N-terminal domain-containing protein n=1 Tax=Acidiplasma cupricumulans TaxID=312540 RepID=UPI000B26B1B4
IEIAQNKDISKTALIKPLKDNAIISEFGSEDYYKKFYADSTINPEKYWDCIASKFEWYKNMIKLLDEPFPDLYFLQEAILTFLIFVWTEMR